MSGGGLGALVLMYLKTRKRGLMLQNITYGFTGLRFGTGIGAVGVFRSGGGRGVPGGFCTEISLSLRSTLIVGGMKVR